MSPVRPRIFLLSPATCSGPRAQMLVSDRAQFDLAERIRSKQGAPLGEVFTFLSGLYFRGKIAYALTFARPPRRLRRDYIPANGTRSEVGGVFVITPSRGLQMPDYPVTADVLARLVEVTPATIRLRKRILQANQRPKPWEG